MNDFEQFERERARDLERDQKAAVRDIADDDAWERKHQRVRTVRGFLGLREKRPGLTPVTGFAAGTWAQVLLGVVYFGGLGVLTGALHAPVRGVTWGTLVAAAVLARVTWHGIGPRGRDGLRAGVRVIGIVAAVIVVAAVVWARLR